jgi:hypothetical protein
MRQALGGVAILAIAISLGGCSGVPVLSASNRSLGPKSTATRTAESVLYKLNHGNLDATVGSQILGDGSASVDMDSSPASNYMIYDVWNGTIRYDQYGATGEVDCNNNAC